MEFDWGTVIKTAGDLYKSYNTSQATANQASTATANASAAAANLQAQQFAQQNLQNQLLLASQRQQSISATNPNSNNTILWVSVGLGAVLLITVFIITLAKRA